MGTRSMALAAFLLTLGGASPAAAVTGFAPEFRVSTTVADEEPNRAASFPQAATNPATGETLVVWNSDQAADNVWDVSGQFLSSSGSELGGDFVVSSLGTAQTTVPNVAVDAEHDRFLVVYAGDDADAGTAYDIFARLYDGDGTALTGQFRVPHYTYTGTEQGVQPHAIYNPLTDAYLVVWSDTRAGSALAEVYGRIVSAAGVPQGTQDTQVSERSATYSSVAGTGYNDVAVTAAGEYVVVFDGSQGMPTDKFDKEIWLQRLTSGLAATPSNTDVQVSSVPSGLGAGTPTVALDGTSGRLLIAYLSGEDGQGNVFGRIIDGTGTFLTTSTQISNNTGSFDMQPDAAGGGGRFAVEFLRYVTSPIFAAHVQELTSDGTMIDGDTPVRTEANTLFGDVTRAGDSWLTVYYRSTSTVSHADVFGRFAGSGAVVQPPGGGGSNGGGGGGSGGASSGGGTAPPAPVVTPALPSVRAPAPAALPAFATIVSLPSTRRCVSRRNFRIRLRTRGLRVASATVTVNGRRVRVVRGGRLTAPVDLRNLPKGRFTVKIVLVLADGRRVQGTRRYRTCAPKRRG